MSDVTLSEILEECGVTAEHGKALGCMEKRSLYYINKNHIVNIGPYNTFILKLLKSYINLQFVTGVSAMLTYLTSYLCKPEHTTTKLTKKASKEAYGKRY